MFKILKIKTNKILIWQIKYYNSLIFNINKNKIMIINQTYIIVMLTQKKVLNKHYINWNNTISYQMLYCLVKLNKDNLDMMD